MAVFLGWQEPKTEWGTYLPGVVPSGPTKSELASVHLLALSATPRFLKQPGFEGSFHLPVLSSTARDSTSWGGSDNHLQAVWSDGHTLQRSDSFDLKKWKAECLDDSAKIKRHQRRKQKERQPQSGQTLPALRSPKASSAGLSSPGVQPRRDSRTSSRLAETYATSQAGTDSFSPCTSISRQLIVSRIASGDCSLPTISQQAWRLHFGAFGISGAISRGNIDRSEENGQEQAKRFRRHEQQVKHQERKRANAWRTHHKVQPEIQEVKDVIENVMEEEVEEVVQEVKHDDRVLGILDRLNRKKDESVGVNQDATSQERISDLCSQFIRKIKPAGTVEKRMSLLSFLRKEKKQKQKSERLAALRQGRFDALPRNEKDFLRKAFSHFDADGSCTLDLKELRHCLKELGLRGNNAEEKQVIAQICQESAASSCASQNSDDQVARAEIDFFEFVVELVPQVRGKLADLRRPTLFAQFVQYDSDSSGKLSLEEVRTIAKELNINEEDINLKWLKEYADLKVDQEVDIDTFQKLISALNEKSQREKRLMERYIQQLHNIDDETFDQTRCDLVNLWDAYQRFDEDNSGYLDETEYLQMLHEFGIMPKNKEDAENIKTLIVEACAEPENGLTFLEFLKLAFAIRELAAFSKIEEQKAAFHMFDKDGSGCLSGSEIVNSLAAMDICPKSKAEQDEIRQIIEDADQDGSGSLTFAEFQSLSQRVSERLQAMQLQREIQKCQELGFSETEYKQFRWAFDRLDDDGSNSMDITEVRTALTLLHLDVSGDQLREAFAAIDQDGSGHLNFMEYMNLMKTILDKEGIFSEGPAKNSSVQEVVSDPS